jgi:hypothetical protein
MPAAHIGGYFPLPVGRSRQAADRTSEIAARCSRDTPACVPLIAARYARTRLARGCPTCSRARIASTDGAPGRKLDRECLCSLPLQWVGIGHALRRPAQGCAGSR